MTDHSANSASDPVTEARAVRRFAMLLIVVVASAMSFTQIVQSTPLQSANDRSRWETVWSLVERGTFQIDEIDAVPGWGTIDKVRHEGDFYSSKPPLQSTLVAGVYWCVKRLTGWNLTENTVEVSRLVLLIVNWLPQVLSLIVIAMLVERYARRDFGKLFVLVVASWATLLGPFTSSLNNHSPAAICVVLALYPLLRVITDGEHRNRFFALVGFFAAATFTFELPAALLVVVFGAMLFKVDRKRTLTVFVPAALIPIVAFVALNCVVTGSLSPFYSSYGSDKYVYEHAGIPSYWSHPQGLDRNLDSPLMYFVHCTIGHHGLLSLTPVWLLTLVGWLGWRRWPECRQRTMLIVGAGLTAVVLGFYLTRTQNYNYGGNSIALRWMLWLAPLWLLAMIPVFDAWGSRRGFQILSSCLLAASVVSASLPGSNPWQSTWLLSAMERWGWLEYSESPPPFEFGHPLWSWFPKLGDPAIEGRVFVRFAGTGANLLGTVENPFSDNRFIGEFSLTVETDKRTDPKLPNIQAVTFRWNHLDHIRSAFDSAPKVGVTIDNSLFNVGRKSSEFLRLVSFNPDTKASEALSFRELSDAGGDTRERLLAAQRLVTGLPQSVEYKPGHIRYLKTPLRSEKAFRCQRAAAQVLFQPQHFDHPLRYRCDLWLCNEIPFGVAQIEITITDPPTGQMLTFQRLTAVEASPFPSLNSSKPH